jgi:mannose-6-phosphate isomerase-like protein (cupin superfamily)
VIVSGNLAIMLDGEKLFKAPGDTIFIPLGSQHRAWNETEDVVVFI